MSARPFGLLDCNVAPFPCTHMFLVMNPIRFERSNPSSSDKPFWGGVCIKRAFEQSLPLRARRACHQCYLLSLLGDGDIIHPSQTHPNCLFEASVNSAH